VNGRVKDCACGLLIANDRILLGRRTADRRIYPNVWDVIGGHLEPGETLEQALIREVEEEVGVTPTAFTRLTTIAEPNPDINGERAYHMYDVRDWRGGAPRRRGDEHTEIAWFTLDEALALDLAIAAYRDLFRQILASLH